MGKSKSNSSAGGNLAVGGAILSSGAGSAICDKDDNSFTCTLNRGVGNLQNLIFVFGAFYFAYYAVKNRKKYFKIRLKI